MVNIVDNIEEMPSKMAAERLFLDALMRDEYAIGAPIRESVLAKKLNIARTGVREMLNQALNWGVVEYTPYSGFSIRNFTLQDTLEWYQLREALEPVAARLFAEKPRPEVWEEMAESCRNLEQVLGKDVQRAWECDSHFHELILLHCGNTAMAALHPRIYVTGRFFFHLLLQHLPQFPTPDIQGTIYAHRRILDAAQSGDAHLAEYLMRNHLQAGLGSFRQQIMELKEKSIPPKKSKK